MYNLTFFFIGLGNSRHFRGNRTSYWEAYRGLGEAHWGLSMAYLGLSEAYLGLGEV